MLCCFLLVLHPIGFLLGFHAKVHYSSARAKRGEATQVQSGWPFLPCTGGMGLCLIQHSRAIEWFCSSVWAKCYIPSEIFGQYVGNFEGRSLKYVEFF